MIGQAMRLRIADSEIARFHEILRQIDELEVDFDRIRHIRDIVRSYDKGLRRWSARLSIVAPVAGTDIDIMERALEALVADIGR